MKKVLLDSSILIDFLRRVDKEETFLQKISNNNFYISIITHTELYGGKSIWERQAARRELVKLFSIITILPLVTEISEIAGKIKAFNPQRSLMDCIIAATAIHHKLLLATFNVKDFEKIDKIKLFPS